MLRKLRVACVSDNIVSEGNFILFSQNEITLATCFQSYSITCDIRAFFLLKTEKEMLLPSNARQKKISWN